MNLQDFILTLAAMDEDQDEETIPGLICPHCNHIDVIVMVSQEQAVCIHCYAQYSIELNDETRDDD